MTNQIPLYWGDPSDPNRVQIGVVTKVNERQGQGIEVTFVLDTTATAYHAALSAGLTDHVSIVNDDER